MGSQERRSGEKVREMPEFSAGLLSLEVRISALFISRLPDAHSGHVSGLGKERRAVMGTDQNWVYPIEGYYKHLFPQQPAPWFCPVCGLLNGPLPGEVEGGGGKEE
jgi:hypothetical protein